MPEPQTKLFFQGTRAWIISLICIFVLLSTSGFSLTHVKINNAPEVYFPTNSPAIIFENQLREQFPSDQTLITLLQGPKLYDTEILARIKRVEQKMAAHPLVERALSVLSMDHISGSEDGFTIEALLDPEKHAHLTSDQRRARVLGDRLATGVLATKDGSALAIVIRPKSLNSSFQRLEIETVLDHAFKEEGLEHYVIAKAGPIAQDAAELRSTLHDNITFIPMTLILGLALIGWMFRKPFAILMAGLAMTLVTTGALAILPLMNQPYTLVTTMAAPLLASLTIALLIHFYTAMSVAEQHGIHGSARVVRAIKEIRGAARFTSITTIAGFGSLMFSSIPPIQMFGIVGVLGEILVYFTVIVLLPPLFMRWDKKAWRRNSIGMRGVDFFVSTLSNFGIRRAGWASGLFLLAIIASLPFIWQIKAETDLLKFFTDAHPLTQSTKIIEEKLAGITPLEVVFDTAETEGMKNPERLQAIHAFQQWAETQPEISRALSMVDIVEDMNWAFHGEDPSFRVIPQNQNLISQLLLVYDGRDLSDFVDNNYQRTRVALMVNAHGATEIGTVIKKLETHLKQQPLQSMDWHIAGGGRLFADQQELLVMGQVKSLWGAVIQIFIIMLILWRSLLAASICIIPNIAPIYATYVLMGASGIWLDMGTALIASVALGVAVDDTIHLFHGYSERVKRGMRPTWALARNYKQAGRAVTATSFILCIPFFLLTFSEFQPTAHFGLLTTFGLLTAMLFDLLLLPALLIAVSNIQAQHKQRV